MKKAILLLVLVILVSGCATERTVTYSKDIRNEYCGIVVPAAVCKCAFHGEMCEEAGMTKEEADANLNNGFDSWEEQGVDGFKEGCESENGRYDNDGEKSTCTYCDDGNWEDDERRDYCIEEK